MRIRALHTALLSAGLLLPAPRDHGPQRASSLRLISLRTEYLVDPLSIDTRIPRLSWIIDAGTARGVRQSAYQIEVASTPANLAADKADLWDSGKAASNRQNQIEYQGARLASRQQLFWKVRIWDQLGAPSEWSKPAGWSMGLLEKADWSAQWIGDPLPSVDNVAATTLRHRGAAGRRMVRWRDRTAAGGHRLVDRHIQHPVPRRAVHASASLHTEAEDTGRREVERGGCRTGADRDPRHLIRSHDRDG